MTETPHPGVVLFVSDLRRAARFFESVAGCRIGHASADYLTLDAAGLELVLHRIPAEVAGPEDGVGHDSGGSAPAVREDASLKLCLVVASLGEARARAAEQGGGLRDASWEWDGDGYRACDGWDPEGNVVQFREPLRTSV